MAAPKGNTFWTKRSKHGRDKIFASPELMLEAFEEYCSHVEKNPFYEVEKGQGNTSKVVAGFDENGNPVLKDNVLKMPKMKPFTLEGVSLFFGAHKEYLLSFERDLKKTDPQREGFLQVINIIKDTVRTQKFSGAAAGFFKENIIARDLGLADRVNSENVNHNFNMNSHPLEKDEIKEIGNALEDNF